MKMGKLGIDCQMREAAACYLLIFKFLLSLVNRLTNLTKAQIQLMVVAITLFSW